jgi:8-oxo-dGTP diphosphatase
VPPPPRYPVGADAVVIAPFEDGDRVLLVRRGTPPPGWAIPGGFVEPHEDLPDAARRELREETGIVLNSLEHIGAYGHPDRDPRGRIIGIVFGARLDAPPEVTAGDDAADARWFPINELPDEIAFDHRDALLDAIEQLCCGCCDP